MKKQLLILIFLTAFLSAHSQERTKTLRSYYFDEQYDSVLNYGAQLQSTDKKLAKEESADYFIVLSHLELNNYEIAIKQSNYVLRSTHRIPRTRLNSKNNRLAQRICIKLSAYYKVQGNFSKAKKYLTLIEKKFYFLFCGNGRKSFTKRLYNELIDCYEKLNTSHKVKKYQRKLEKL